MLGNNIKQKILKGSGDILEIVDIFKTFQGEGFFQGHPAIFVRLGGCNLACKFCDTNFDIYEKKELSFILKKVNLLAENKISLVVITGGEPLRQPIEKLCKTLLKNGFKVQIETNGTINRKLPKKVHIIISPKNEGLGGYKSLNTFYNNHQMAYKFLISKFIPKYSKLPNFISEIKQPVYIQPIDELDSKKNSENLEYAKQLCLQHNLILSIQLHKIIDVP
jgi:7-carboxy-7-deazaguanine synthase